MTAPTAESTDFARIATLYPHLSRVAPSPLVELNRAIAVAFSEGPDAGLALLETLHLDSSLGECNLMHATRADLLRRLGRPTDAVPHYRRALELVSSDPEHVFSDPEHRILQRRLDDLARRC